MKSLLMIIAVVCLVSTAAFAQMDMKNVDNTEKPVKIVQKSRKVMGPEAKNHKYKNAEVTTRTYTVVKNKNLQGPDAKNQRAKLGERKPSTVKIGENPKAKLKGPEAKNYKHWPKKEE